MVFFKILLLKQREYHHIIMDKYCCMCLSQNRLMTAVTEFHLQQLLMINLELKIIESICWECKARMSTMMSFRLQVQEAQLKLQKIRKPPKNPLKTLSKLSSHHKKVFDVCVFDDCTISKPYKKMFKNASKICNLEIKEEIITNESNNDKKSEEDNYFIDSDHDYFDQIKSDNDNATNDNIVIRSDKRSVKYKYTCVEIKLSELKEYRHKESKSKKTADAPFKCETCILGYYTLEKYNRHFEKFHNPSNEYKCNLCDQSFSESDTMMEHWNAHFYLYKCNLCDFETLNPKLIVNHFDQNHKKSSYPCHMCPKEFRTYQSQRYHIDMSHRATKRCEICLKDVKFRSYKNHVESHNAPYLKCPHCQKMFKVMETYRKHVKSHKKVTEASIRANRAAYCIECDKTFKNQNIYKTHLRLSLKHRREEDVLKNKFICAHCDKQYCHRSELERHMILHHLPALAHTCNVCDKKYSRADHLRAHVAHVHAGVPRARAHVCMECGKAFTAARSLKVHSLIHTGIKPHHCPACDARFTQRGTMLTHLRAVHLKQRTRNRRNKL